MKRDDTLQPDELLRVSVYDGKYTVIQKKPGGMTFLRHGEPWPSADANFAHVGMILALAQEVEGLREQAPKKVCGFTPVEAIAKAIELGAVEGFEFLSAWNEGDLSEWPELLYQSDKELGLV